MKKLAIVLFFISLINNAKAISISEIMYDPAGSDTGREWVEIFNDTSGDIDFTSWKFNEAGTNHGITAYSVDKIIRAGSYGVIADNPAKFLIDNPGYTGVLYDSSFSLSNSGELIVLKDNSLIAIDSINYSASIGGNDDGSTLSFINSSWTRGMATPGVVNTEELIATSTVSTTTSSLVISPVLSVALPDIFLLIPEKINAIAGADKVFSVKAVNSTRKEIDGLEYVWSFGDGGTKTGKNVSYHYSYPGVYNVVVEASGIGYFERNRLKAIVTAPQISIIESNVGVAGLYIDLKNNSQTEVDISDWILDINSEFYTIPKNTILSANSITKISGNSLGVSTSTINSIQNGFINTKLFYPDHSFVLNFNATTSVVIPEDKKETQKATTTIIRPITAVSATKNDYTKISVKPKQLETKSEIATTTQITKEYEKKDRKIVVWIKDVFNSWFK